jgi:hypothetical protein
MIIGRIHRPIQVSPRVFFTACMQQMQVVTSVKSVESLKSMKSVTFL